MEHVLERERERERRLTHLAFVESERCGNNTHIRQTLLFFDDEASQLIDQERQVGLAVYFFWRVQKHEENTRPHLRPPVSVAGNERGQYSTREDNA